MIRVTVGNQGARCPRCAAQLRRDQSAGSVCDPCGRTGWAPLPAEFFTPEPLRRALRDYSFGPFFRRLRGYRGWTQTTLGRVLDLSQTKISAIEGGTGLYDIRVIVKLHQRLGVPASLLGFGVPATVAGSGVTERKDVSWVDRRDFVSQIAGTTLGLAAAGVDVERLLALLPQAEPTGTRHIGTADVETIEQATAAFRGQDFAHGSGLVRSAAVAQLQAVLPLLSATSAADIRSRLLLAAADLATQAGWLSYDSKYHDAARRLWTIGLNLARETDHPRGTDLTVYLIFDMAHQAVHLGRPDEAVHLIRVGETAAVGRYPVSGSTTFALASIEAWGHAAQGDAEGCERALGKAEERFVTSDPANRPPWAAHLVDDTDLAAHQGAAHYRLALNGQSPSAASRAVPLLRYAVDRFGPAYARAQALYLPDLAGAHALAGDLDTAVTVGHQAVDAVTEVSSPRASDRLRTLHTVLEPMHHSANVAELRERLVATAA